VRLTAVGERQRTQQHARSTIDQHQTSRATVVAMSL
jgi:hypothetical protein